jgi:hypothetical protein
MHTRRNVGRWLCMVFIAGASGLAVGACGSSGGGNGGTYDGSVDGTSLSFDSGKAMGCKPLTCKDRGFTCGKNGDGCGGTIDCGTCSGTDYCGGGGYSKCGNGTDGGTTCMPKTCADYPAGTCGQQTDGCGGVTAVCGDSDASLCPVNQVCGVSVPGMCGYVDGGLQGDASSLCTKKTCADYPAGTCGAQTDGCGTLTDVCGTNDAGGLCPAGQTCGGGGSGLCGVPTLPDAGDAGLCQPATCASLGNPCGPQGDGCGGQTIACTTCPSGQWCGGGGANVCGNGFSSGDGGEGGLIGPCVPKTCANFPTGTCGIQSDGCGGVTAPCNANDAGSFCASGQYCGGGGPGLCGNGIGLGDAGPCTPKTCNDYSSNACGQQSDGCGGLTANCNSTCPTGQFCGGGGSGVCGTGPGVDAGVCNPKTCANYPGTCGQHSDGCGGLTANCATCPTNQYCGGGGAGICGGGAAVDGGTCTPWTCSHYVGKCGPQSDGCGGLTANCGTCPLSQFCGGGGPGICGGSTGLGNDGGPISSCVPKTCAGQGFNCGYASDGCGGTIGPCGSACIAPQACGAGGQANVCGSNIACTGLCTQQVKCDGGGVTTLTGTVVAGTISNYLPAGVTYGDPVPNVLVYVPNGTVSAFLPRNSETFAQQCTTCGADVTGNPLVVTNTKYDGTFTLSNVPVGSSIPLVIQLGRWRRQFTVNIGTSCGANTVNATGMPAGILRMPRTQAEGDIPLTAISTGNVDAMECVLLKMGIAASEFTLPSGTGRVQMYQGNGAVSSLGPTTTPAETALMGTQSGATANGSWNSYDEIILPCWGVDPTTGGSSNAKSAAALANLVAYGSNGGHFFATHYSYAWLYNNSPYSLTAAWNVNHNTNIGSMTGVVSQTVPPTVPVTNPGVFVQWLNKIQALSNFTPANPPPNPADVTIANARHDVNNILRQSVDWIDGKDPGDNSNMLLHYTFDTPVTSSDGGIPSYCGHAIFSDFHVSNSSTNGTPACSVNADCASTVCTGASGTNCTRNAQCPGSGCNTGTGKCNDGACGPLEFPAQSDLSAYCNATPMTAQEKILEYMIWDLAQCVPGQPTSTCSPKSCTDFPSGTCGVQGDGCGGLTTNCGTCPSGQTCGGGGVAAQCGAPDSGTCTAQTCATYPVGTCGQQADGCGGLTANCDNCPAGQTCGGGGVTGVCGSSPTTCTAMTCSSYPSGTCGQQSDGCGGLTANCTCPAGQSCVSGQCQTNPTCTPVTCSSYATGTCGQQSDGCGGLTSNCPCPTGQSCGGAGVAGQCGTPPTQSSCVPLTCTAYPGVCGQQSDGCGGLTADCNPCTPPATCGGGGQAGVCGTPPDASGCIPQTCNAYPNVCGVQSDGCGGVTAYCNPCTAPATCGGGGTPGVCGSPQPPPCTKLTCNDYPSTTCGQQSDGCGGLTNDCNPCTPPATCGGAGVAGMCGTPPTGSCVPKTCTDYPNVCGQQANGCGGLTPVCNPCTLPQTCGGGGTPGVCGMGGTCTPKTCSQLGFNCGQAGDGCGGLLDCGTCPSGQTCGTSGSPGVCSNLPM